MPDAVVTYDAAGAIAGTYGKAPAAATTANKAAGGARAVERRGLHACYKVMIVSTFLIVVAVAITGTLALTSVITVPGVTPNVRGGTPSGEASSAEEPFSLKNQTLGRTGLVEPDANERGTGPVAAWTVLRPLASRPACVDLREFPSEVQKELLEEARKAMVTAAANKGDATVAIADAKACHGALVARKPTAAGTDNEFGVPAASANNAKGGRRLANLVAPVPSAVDFPLVTTGVPSLSSLPTSDGAAAAAAAAASSTYIWATNLAALSKFFITIRININWEAYYDGQCRHEYTATHTPQKIKFDFRPNGGRCQGSNAAYYKPCLFHPVVSATALNACVGPDCASTMQAKSDEMYKSSVSVVRMEQPAGTKEAIVKTNAGLGQNDADKRKVQVAAALFSTNTQASHCPAAPWTHRRMMGGGSLTESADFGDYWRVYANDQSAGFAGREYVENYPHNFVMDTEVNLVSSLEAEIKAAIKQEQPEANSVGAEVTILDPRSFSVYTTLVLDRDATFSATKYIQTRTQYQIVHHKNTIQVGVFHRTWAWQTSSSVFWFVGDALDDGASGMARTVSAQVSATLAERFAESLPAGADGGVVDASATTLVLGEDGQVFALVAF